MKKILIITGELSGDRLAAWYVRKLKAITPDVHIQAVGGDFLQREGAIIVERFEKLNVVGLVEIASRLPFILRTMHYLVAFIKAQQFDEVVLVDFPGFNLRIARMLARGTHRPLVTYLSPPQLWCWGAWRVRSLRKYCDRIIVLYPFEIMWYMRRGVHAEWLGNPVYDQLASYGNQRMVRRQCIAIMPGSRASEIERLLPLMLKAARCIQQQLPEVHFVLPLARSLSKNFLERMVHKHHLHDVWHKVTVVHDEHEKYLLLAQCCVAISKPGTVTLELALLHVPTVVVFKISWFTYLLARLLIKVSSMTLPNLLLKKQVYQEIIQFGCSDKHVAQEVMTLYHHVQAQDDRYDSMMKDCDAIAALLK